MMILSFLINDNKFIWAGAKFADILHNQIYVDRINFI